jgi:hypothetical protein
MTGKERSQMVGMAAECDVIVLTWSERMMVRDCSGQVVDARRLDGSKRFHSPCNSIVSTLLMKPHIRIREYFIQ